MIMFFAEESEMLSLYSCVRWEKANVGAGQCGYLKLK
jgi:hypothetical protein